MRSGGTAVTLASRFWGGGPPCASSRPVKTAGRTMAAQIRVVMNEINLLNPLIVTLFGSPNGPPQHPGRFQNQAQIAPDRRLRNVLPVEGELGLQRSGEIRRLGVGVAEELFGVGDIVE